MLDWFWKLYECIDFPCLRFDSSQSFISLQYCSRFINEIASWTSHWYTTISFHAPSFQVKKKARFILIQHYFINTHEKIYKKFSFKLIIQHNFFLLKTLVKSAHYLSNSASCKSWMVMNKYFCTLGKEWKKN